MITLDKSAEFMQDQSKKSEDLGEDTHYCLSIAPKLKRCNYKGFCKAVNRESAV